jgi:hypothetical protein
VLIMTMITLSNSWISQEQQYSWMERSTKLPLRAYDAP